MRELEAFRQKIPLQTGIFTIHNCRRLVRSSSQVVVLKSSFFIPRMLSFSTCLCRKKFHPALTYGLTYPISGVPPAQFHFLLGRKQTINPLSTVSIITAYGIYYRRVFYTYRGGPTAEYL